MLAYPSRSPLLDILSFLSVADLCELKEDGENALTIRRVADQLGEVPGHVRNVVGPFLRNDLQDYTAEYERFSAAFENLNSECAGNHRVVRAGCE